MIDRNAKSAGAAGYDSIGYVTDVLDLERFEKACASPVACGGCGIQDRQAERV